MTLGEREGYVGRKKRGEREKRKGREKRKKKRCVLSVSKRK